MKERDWKALSPHQLGRYSEYYAKMEFAAFGCDVYTSEVDDHGIDFVAKHKGKFYEIQVKSVRNLNYIFIKAEKMPPVENGLVCCLLYGDSREPDVYIIPAEVWKSGVAPFVCHVDYKTPEYGINLSKKNLPMLEQYRAEVFFENWN